MDCSIIEAQPALERESEFCAFMPSGAAAQRVASLRATGCAASRHYRPCSRAGLGTGGSAAVRPGHNPACLRRGLSCGLGPLTAAHLVGVEEVERYLG